MGRTHQVRTLLNEIRSKSHEAESAKKKYSDYLKKLEEGYSKGKISYSTYVETLHKKREGRNIKEWVDYLDKYEKDCKKEARKEKTKNTAKKFITVCLSVFIVGILFFLISNNGFSFIGFAIQNGQQEFSQQVGLQFENSTSYDLQIKQFGRFDSLRLTGTAEGNGTIKIYFEDLLAFEYSGELNTGIPQQNMSPSQEGFLSSVNFSDFCNQTCDLSSLSLNKSSYMLRMEISDANLSLDKITYYMSPIKKPKQIPAINQTTSSNQTITQNQSQQVQNQTVPTNQTNETIPAENNQNVQTIQEQAVLNQPVKWEEQITPSDVGNLTVDIPSDATNVSVSEVDSQNKTQSASFKKINSGKKVNFEP